MDQKALRRFESKIQRERNGCLTWTAGKFKQGYGSFWLNPGYRKAHRVAYEHVHGPIPDGLKIDHICRNRACVRPDHLRAVTQRENVMAPGSESLTKKHSLKTKCPRGHAYDVVRRNGVRRNGASVFKRCCRACERIHSRNYYRRNQG